MANTTANVVWYGPAAAQGQEQSQGGLSGSQSRAMTGIATTTLDGATGTVNINWIDGVQKPFQTVILAPVLSVTAPATIGGVANQAVYSGVGAYGQLKVGQSVTFAGFTNAGNNGTFTINALTTSTIQVTNSSSVAETNPAATVAFNLATGALVAGAFAVRSVTSAAGVADTAANTIAVTQIGTITQTGAICTLSANGSNGNTLSILVQL
jgi:hypothetical protein